MTYRLLPCLLFALCISFMTASAQDQGSSNTPVSSQPPLSPAPAAESTNTPAPADPLAPAANSGAGSPGQNPPASDPNSLIPPPLEPQQPSPINSAGNEEKQRQEQKAKYYAVKVKADKEEGLASLLAKSDKAKNDETKREILREYYDLLAKRMKKIDPSISDWIDTMHSAYLRRIQQIRVEPSIPEGVPPTPDSSASPSPSVTPHYRKHKKADDEDAAPAAEASPTPSKKSSSKASPSPTPSRKASSKSSPSPTPKSSSKKKSDSNND